MPRFLILIESLFSLLARLLKNLRHFQQLKKLVACSGCL
jgi:hypothetical protein